MYDQIIESSDTERLADVFIALVQESALLNLENIQKVRSYARFLLADQQTEEALFHRPMRKKAPQINLPVMALQLTVHSAEDPMIRFSA